MPKTLCVFAHFDKDNMVDPYVYYYLNELKRNFDDLVFVTTAKISETDQNKIERMGVEVILRENVGYDFMSYKTGLERRDLSIYSSLALCNDSVYGPLYPLEEIINKAKKSSADLWGITNSHQQHHHIQSYFLIFKNKVISSIAFKEFWDNVNILNTKQEIITTYEVGLSKTLSSAGFTLGSSHQTEKVTPMEFITSNKNKYLRLLIKRFLKRDFYRNFFGKIKHLGSRNPTHQLWKELLEERSSPFIKIELLKANPTQVHNVQDFNAVKDFIKENFNYPIALIENHLQRHKKHNL